VVGYGYFDGLGAPNRIGFIWEKFAGTLTSGERTQLATILSFLGSYITAEEVPTGVDSHVNWEPVITTDAAGTTPTGADNQAGASGGVDTSLGMHTGSRGQVLIRVHAGGSPTTKLLRWSQWAKALAAFTGGEQTALNSFVAALGAYLAADLPAPPWT
jgi:hypothetical protein